MTLNLKRPCKHCPFRNDIKFPLLRSDEIARDLLYGKSFQCHETVQTSANYEHCAGAMIVLHKMDRHNQLMQIAYRLNQWDPDSLDLSSPVYDDLDQFIQGTTT